MWCSEVTGVNACEYFNLVRRGNQKVIDNSEKHLPWNYQENNASPLIAGF
ncbi:MAG: hypothetical protein OFPII_41310 [Osedax symbiont Rs1]|nr:MAG: hypothetical protein OFPII_41310 [Osedax symbiont Rs1]